jgi:glyoxylase-like metal-dependent hydrolase (beta-lactamase superfamily II)
VVVVAGDVFWSAEGEEPALDVDRADGFAVDMARLRESRQRLLRIADWIVPGHGRRLRVER